MYGHIPLLDCRYMYNHLNVLKNIILGLFRDDIAVLVKPRILIPNVSQCYEEIVLNKNNVSVTWL